MNRFLLTLFAGAFVTLSAHGSELIATKLQQKLLLPTQPKLMLKTEQHLYKNGKQHKYQYRYKTANGQGSGFGYATANRGGQFKSNRSNSRPKH